MRKRILLTIFILSGCFLTKFCEAQNKLTVKDLSSLQTEINQAKPGTTLVLANGSYTSETPIIVNRQGTQAQPITISAETTGGVEIKGAAGFVISGPAAHIVIQGFNFTHQAGTTKIEVGATYCRITRNCFECTGKGAYLTVSGDDNRIDHNTFQHKFTEGQMISVQGPGSSGMAQRTVIHHNYFYDFKPTSNNCSSIQVGLSGRSLSAANTVVEYNLFVQTRGENENICNKSCNNTYRYNTFGEGSSELSLRHGNNCQVYANFFLGSEGVRFYGHNHKIFSNFFEGCNPAVNIGNGDGIVPKDKLTSHDRPDTCFVVFNTLLNNKRNIIMQGRKDGLGATCISVANNIIQGGNEAFKIDGTIQNPTWAGNLIWQTADSGNIPAEGYAKCDPALANDGTTGYHLQKNSMAIGRTSGNYPFVTIDIDGFPVVGKMNAGADQFPDKKIYNHILTTGMVGPLAP